MYRYYFKVCPTNWCYDADIVADDMQTAVTMMCLRENVDIEYLVFIKYEYVA